MKTYVIAEAGVNHNGSLEIAKKMVTAAKACGADCIKFQTFKAESLVSKSAPMAEYQKKNTGVDDSQYKMLKALELTYNEFAELSHFCKSEEIDFLSTPFDFESIEFLSPIVSLWKIPSGEITNLPYLEKLAKTHKPIILSTGMSTMDEINDAVKVFKNNGSDDITILHCTTQYPAPIDSVNLLAMQSIQRETGCPVGYSDHTDGCEIPLAAVAIGAVVIEKHFTLDRGMEGPDHKASLEPDALKTMIEGIRKIELALGNGIKAPTEDEKKNIQVARKSIVASSPIKPGDVFSEKNLTTKRPGTGISPMKWYNIIGKTSSLQYDADDIIIGDKL